MKGRKFFGILFTVLGSMTVFFAAAVLLLPLFANEQMNLVLDSFYLASDNILVNAINAVMRLTLENGFLMLILGAGLLVCGILFLLSASRYEEEENAKRNTALRRSAAQGSQRKAPPMMQRTAPPAAPAAREEENPFVVYAAQTPTPSPKVSAPPPPEQTAPPAEETAAPAALPVQKPMETEDGSLFAAPAAKVLGYRSITDTKPREEEPFTMQPDDSYYSPGSARRIGSAPKSPVQQEAPAEEDDHFASLFSLSSPAQDWDRPEKAAVPDPQPDPKPDLQPRDAAPAAVPAVDFSPKVASPLPAHAETPAADKPKTKVIIRSTMGKHTV